MITINFASRNYRLLERVRIAVVTAVVVLCATMLGLVWAAVSLRADISALDARLKEIGKAEEQVRPLLKEREQLVKDLSAMSGLMEARRFSWTRLLTSIEAVVPVGVALSHVQFNPGDRSLSLDGAAQSPESLRNLVVGLEQSASFKDPFLKHQSVEKGSISFNVAAVYREDASAAVAQGK